MRWATRARPHVDRCATAWLLRRFVDPEAEFVFLPPGAAPPEDATPFDLPGVHLGHRGDRCTFDAAVEEHGLGGDAALRGLADLVRDLDFHRFARPESAGLDAVLTGLRLAEADDHRVLDRAGLIFDALYAREHARLAGG